MIWLSDLTSCLFSMEDSVEPERSDEYEGFECKVGSALSAGVVGNEVRVASSSIMGVICSPPWGRCIVRGVWSFWPGRVFYFAGSYGVRRVQKKGIVVRWMSTFVGGRGRWMEPQEGRE